MVMANTALTDKTAVKAAMIANDNNKASKILATVWNKANTMLVEGLTGLTAMVNKAKVVKTTPNFKHSPLGSTAIKMQRTARQKMQARH